MSKRDFSENSAGKHRGKRAPETHPNDNRRRPSEPKHEDGEHRHRREKEQTRERKITMKNRLASTVTAAAFVVLSMACATNAMAMDIVNAANADRDDCNVVRLARERFAVGCAERVERVERIERCGFNVAGFNRERV